MPGQLTSGEYSVYYGSDYIKYIHATPVTTGTSTAIEYIKYPKTYISTIEASPGYSPLYSATPSSINLYEKEIIRSSNGYYKLAYFNEGTDWINGLSQVAGAKVVSSFSGPKVRVHGSVGPGYGKFKIRISTKQVQTSDTENVILDWFEVDCFSLTEKEAIIFEKTNLEYLEYNIEIETLQDKNVLSTSSSVRVNKISFLTNFNFSLGNQIINPDLSFKSIGGIK